MRSVITYDVTFSVYSWTWWRSSPTVAPRPTSPTMTPAMQGGMNLASFQASTPSFCHLGMEAWNEASMN